MVDQDFQAGSEGAGAQAREEYIHEKGGEDFLLVAHGRFNGESGSQVAADGKRGFLQKAVPHGLGHDLERLDDGNSGLYGAAKPQAEEKKVLASGTPQGCEKHPVKPGKKSRRLEPLLILLGIPYGRGIIHSTPP